jgi:prepilin-type N-terminal cleavage/methylation domain-containing protein
MAVKKHNIRGGFTLVEMMTAIAIGAIMMVVVVTAFREGSDLFALSTAKIEAMHSGRVVVDFLTNDQAHFPSAISTDQIFMGAPDNRNGGIDTDDDGKFDVFPDAGQHMLQCVTLEHNAGHRVLYYVTADKRLVRISTSPPEDNDGDKNPDGTLRSWISTNPEDSPGAILSGPDADRQYTLAYGVTSFELRYFYQGEWYSGWDSRDDGDGDSDTGGWDGNSGEQQGAIPEAIELTLEVQDTDGVLGRRTEPLVIRRVYEP